MPELENKPALATAYIVPALTDISGQCRIVMADGNVGNARDSYRAYPDLWKEVGLMNSQGQLVCCENIGNLRQELEDCAPLMAGTQFRIELSN